MILSRKNRVLLAHHKAQLAPESKGVEHGMQGAAAIAGGAAMQGGAVKVGRWLYMHHPCMASAKNADLLRGTAQWQLALMAC